MAKAKQYEVQWYEYEWQYFNLCTKCSEELYSEIRYKVNDFAPIGDADECEYCEIDNESEAS